MPLFLDRYLDQVVRWPRAGRHVMAQFDANQVVVYQAYRPSIAEWAVSHGVFGGPDFSLNRMSWIKTSFLWMMYRSRWAATPGQERIVAVRLHREAFDTILARAVPSSFAADLYANSEAWQADLAVSEVRLQWDPDHHPTGAPQARRAIQLGLRGQTLAQYAGGWIVAIEDVTPMVIEQRAHSSESSKLLTPREDPYPVADPRTRRRLGMKEE